MNKTVLDSVNFLSDWIGNLLHGNRIVEGKFLDKFSIGESNEVMRFCFTSESFEFVVLTDSGASVIDSASMNEVIEFFEEQYKAGEVGFRPEPMFQQPEEHFKGVIEVVNFSHIKTTKQIVDFLIADWKESTGEDLTEEQIARDINGYDIPKSLKSQIRHVDEPDYDEGDGNLYYQIFSVSVDGVTRFIKIEYTYSSWNDNWYDEHPITLVEKGEKVVVDWVQVGD